MKAYAGIGSRQTPEAILGLMEELAYHLAFQGWTLRSGCAQGADSAFETGAMQAHLEAGDEELAPAPELYLPWPGFEGRHGPEEGGTYPVMLSEPAPWALRKAETVHPAWGSLSQGARKLHGRNVHQVLGANLFKTGDSPMSKFVVCWTPDAKGGGGTGQALRLAKANGIPIFDLASPVARGRINHFLQGGG